MNKVILLTNILTPYRVYFYDLLYKEFKSNKIEFKVLVTGKSEPNRNWNYDDLKREYTILMYGKILILPDNIFIHINFGIKKYIVDEKPNLIISAGSYLYPALWTVLRCKKKLNFSVFYWNESHLNEQRKYGTLKLLFREKIRSFIFKKFDGFWYGGLLSLEFINKYSNDFSIKIFVPNLVDDKFYISSVTFTNEIKQEIKIKYNIESSKIIVICPARITWVKGQLDFLKLFFKSNFNLFFLVLFVGDGDLENELKNLSVDNNNVKFLGSRNQSEMLELYSVSNLFLLPSLSDANPLTCIESLWSGLPLLISKNVGNYPEVVNIGENGFVFDYNDSNSLDNILKKIVNKDKLWFRNASNESLRIANKFYNSEKSTVRIIKETINSLK
jgi:glycosyltransferase involved in cell wall biosynthesis